MMLKGGGLSGLTQRKTHIFSCKMHSVWTMVVSCGWKCGKSVWKSTLAENSQDIFPPWSIRCNKICMWHTKLQWISSGHVLLINNSYLFFVWQRSWKWKHIYIYIYTYIYIYIVLKPRDTLLSCFHMIVVQYHMF